MLEILKGTKEELRKNLPFLAKDYKEKLGRKVCLTCPSDIQYMILSLKNFYKMTKFEFIKPAVQYKNKKGDRTTISNATMTDKKAIEFLKTNPKRIDLFKTYPSNWKDLIEGKKETKKQKEARLAAEAEAEAAAEAKKEKETEELETEEISEKEDVGSDIEADAIAEAKKASSDAPESSSETVGPDRKKLMSMSLTDLRKAYPKIKATSIKTFVDKVLT